MVMAQTLHTQEFPNLILLTKQINKPIIVLPKNCSEDNNAEKLLLITITDKYWCANLSGDC